MLINDILRLSPAKLNERAESLGLEQRGVQRIWVVRKSITDPASKQTRQLKRSTKTADLRTAVLRAGPWVEDFLQRAHEGLPVIREQEFVTVGKVCEFYKLAGSGMARTRRQNVNDLKIMLRLMFPEVDDVLTLSSRVIDGKFARNWQQGVQQAAAKRCLPADVEGFERAKRGANSRLGRAQSIFSKRNRKLYEDAELRVAPGVREFAEELGLEAAEAPAPEMLNEQVVAAIVRGLPELKRMEPGTWACVLLMFQAGLRNIEAEKARWDWMTETEGVARLNLSTADDYTPKGRDGIVLMSPAVVAALRTVRPEGHAFIVPAASPSERRDICHRNVNTFLAACGVQKINGKIAYRLRGHAISRIILEHGLDAGQEFGRHKSRSTTQQYYKGVSMPYQPIAPVMPLGIDEQAG